MRGLLVPRDYRSSDPDPDPDPGGFPTDAGTGHSWGASPPNGTISSPFTINTDNASYSGRLITGNVTITPGTTGVTFDDCLFDGAWVHALYDDVSEVALFTDCTFDGGFGAGNSDQGLGGSGFHVLRCNLRGWPQAISHDHNADVRDSWFGPHYCYGTPPNQVHGEGFLCSGGSGNVLINNTFTIPHTGCLSSCVSFYGDFAQQDDQLIQGNYIGGAGGYALYAGSVSGKPFPLATNFRVIDNVFGTDHETNCGVYGPVTSYNPAGSGNVWSGNTWTESVHPLPSGVSEGDPVNP